MSQNEARRIRELQNYGILDTSPDIAFDRVTHLACDLFDAPIALVSLIDEERQWFKSRQGLDACSTPREWAFCSRAIEMGPEAVMIVEDATLDPRFAANPLVVGELGIRFYVGAVLTTPDGYNLGTLCVIDKKARERPTERELNRLRALARIIVDEMERMRLSRVGGEQARLLQLAETMSGVAHWRYDLVTREVFWSDLIYDIVGVDRQTYVPDIQGDLGIFHPDDRNLVSAMLIGAATTKEACTFQARMVRLDGEVRVVQSKAGCELDEHGEVVALIGLFQDVTEQVRNLENLTASEARYRLLAENTSDVIVRAGLDGTLLYVSPASRGMGYEPEELIGTASDRLMHPEDRDRFLAHSMPLLAGQAPDPAADRQHRYLTGDGRWIWLEGNPQVVRDADGKATEIVNVFRDVTERRALQERAERMASLTALAEEVAGIGYWRLDTVTGEGTWSPHVATMYGLDPGGETRIERFFEMIHPDDRTAVLARLKGAREEGLGWKLAITRIVLPDGRTRYLEGHGRCERDASGQVIGVFGTVMDITTRVAAEIALRASEDRARNLIANAHQAIVTADESGRITGWNRHAELTFGWSAQEAIGADMAMILSSEHAGMAVFLGGGLGDDIDQRIETTARRKDGVEIPIELAVSAVRDAAGWEMTALMHDISERKAQLELFENAFEHAAIGKALVGLDGGFLKVNPALCEMIGYSREELLALDFQKITHPDDLDADLSFLAALYAGKISTYRMDKRYIRKDGAIVWIQLAVSRIDNPDGSPRYFIAQIEDLTARREAEAALKDSEARYRLMAENTTDMIMTTDLKGKVTFVAASCRALIGYAPGEVIGRGAADLAHPEERVHMRRVYRNLVQGKPAERVRWRMPHKLAAREVWLESNPSLLRDPATDAPTGFLDVIRDVTQQVAQEEALAAARADAEAAAAVKGDFMANMSHEIRTPLTAVIGFSGLLSQRPELDEISRRFVQRVSSAGQALLAIVNDVLDFSKLEAGQVEITPRAVSPLAVAQEALSLFAPQADAKGLWLECEADGEVPAQVMMDPDRVRQVLLNLVGNAVKFTERGAVSLFVGYDAEAAILHVRVRDTGAGMSPEQQVKLFQRFSQVDASSTRQHGGTGLGLAICKGLTEAMGGGIAVTSAPEGGSVFSFHIAAPIAITIAPTAEIEPAEVETLMRRLDGVRVLVVDDNAVNRELARTVLEHMGAEVAEATGGRAAVTQAAAEPFDCILMDLRMPELSGEAALAEIRDTPGPNQDVPILAFTADADRDLLSGRHGFDGMVSKPIMAWELVGAVDACTNWTDAAHPDAALEPVRA
jgi:PAS domain S-box-containing protein